MATQELLAAFRLTRLERVWEYNNFTFYKLNQILNSCSEIVIVC